MWLAPTVPQLSCMIGSARLSRLLNKRYEQLPTLSVQLWHGGTVSYKVVCTQEGESSQRTRRRSSLVSNELVPNGEPVPHDRREYDDKRRKQSAANTQTRLLRQQKKMGLLWLVKGSPANWF